MEQALTVDMPNQTALRSRIKLREAALANGPERNQIYQSHPLIKKEARFPTAPIVEAFQVAEQSVVHYESGICILGNPRSGKSTAIEAIKTQLSRTMPGLIVFVVDATGHATSSESNFWTDFLVAFGRSAGSRSTAAKDRGLVVNMIKGTAQQAGADRILLIIDEAQTWGYQDYVYLRDLSNRMRRWGIAMVTILFGHTELLKLREILLSEGKTDLIGRFFNTPYRFRGLNSQVELLEVLSALDNPEAAEYPQGSGICYSEFFLPDDWKAGWRLAQEIEPSWMAFSKVAKRSGRQPNDLGMNWVMNAIKNAILTKMAIPEEKRPNDYDLWLQAVENSGYEASLVLAPASPAAAS
ncbi:ATP-binding protein [Roseateles cellulosilyticus]|uniref:ATP-binding protein n=1 Tax=Pelomonas cellulosilytica TaxID=2906762 RepID=A0ABS8XTI3_9BURK|nr:ATP-binding protein [Pelomonas sp. P8]MCE4555037.1 ATP-binding protein [Pelomonas sp. P8]